MRIPLWYLVVSVAIVAANAAVYAFSLGGPEAVAWTGTLAPIAAAIVGALGVWGTVSALKARDRTRAAWSLLVLGTLLSLLGEVSYLVLERVAGLNVEELGYTVSDVFWILGYLPYMASLLMLLSGYRASGMPMKPSGLFVALILAVAAAAAAAVVFLFVPILGDPDTDGLSKLVYICYPVMDFALLIPAVILISITSHFGKGLLAVPWGCIALAFLLWSASDLAYSWLGWNDSYGDANLVDLGWVAAYLLIGAAGLYQRSILVKD